MKKNMMDILCCPNCKSSLQLTIDNENNDEVIDGSLHCDRCKKTYSISDGIPNFIDEL
jgi:uncharacterized protein YbaR (Trm112 family)